MQNCAICQEPSKYKCPACQTRTCSLNCVNSHKVLFGCTGTPDKTKFVGIKEYGINELHKDMNYLQEITRNSDLAHKQITKITRHDNRKRFMYLINECRQREVPFKILPKIMSKHNSNTSMFQKSEGVIYWHLEWVFASHRKEISVQTAGNSENESLSTHFEKALESFKTNPEFVFEVRNGENKYRVLWLTGKAKVNGKAQRIFEEVSPNYTLRDLVAVYSRNYGPLIEYPTFYFTVEEFISCFNLK